MTKHLYDGLIHYKVVVEVSGDFVDEEDMYE